MSDWKKQFTVNPHQFSSQYYVFQTFSFRSIFSHCHPLLVCGILVRDLNMTSTYGARWALVCLFICTFVFRRLFAFCVCFVFPFMCFVFSKILHLLLLSFFYGCNCFWYYHMVAQLLKTVHILTHWLSTLSPIIVLVTRAVTASVMSPITTLSASTAEICSSSRSIVLHFPANKI